MSVVRVHVGELTSPCTCRQMGGVMEFFFRQMGESSARYGRGRKESARSKRKAHAQPEAEDAGPTQAAGCFSGESGSTSGAMRARLVGALGHGDRPSLNRRTSRQRRGGGRFGKSASGTATLAS